MCEYPKIMSTMPQKDQLTKKQIHQKFDNHNVWLIVVKKKIIAKEHNPPK